MFGTTWEPKSIKINFDNKHAFITANSQDEAERFVKSYKEIASNENTNLFFNLYRTKQERTQSLSYFKKKYNSFGNDQNEMTSGGFDMNMNPSQRMPKNYNDFCKCIILTF